MLEIYKVPLGRWGTYRPNSITIRLSGIRFFSDYLEYWKDYNYCTIMFDKENKQVIFKRMKYFTAMLLLMFWMVATFLLTISILGLIVLLDEDSAWMEFPKKLLSVFGS